jgi:fatty acid synthase, animal type
VQVAGFRNRVLFKDACMAVPDGVVMLEIGPHSILRALIRQCRPELRYVATMQKGTNAMMTLRAAVGELWRLGIFH